LEPREATLSAHSFRVKPVAVLVGFPRPKNQALPLRKGEFVLTHWPSTPFPPLNRWHSRSAGRADGAAALLTVSAGTIYDLFASGELPGRKVGRKWITTKAAVLRWIESSATHDTLTRAIERSDQDALAEALNLGKVRVRSAE
jgi:excisionase family DNA binding protein